MWFQINKINPQQILSFLKFDLSLNCSLTLSNRLSPCYLLSLLNFTMFSPKSHKTLSILSIEINNRPPLMGFLGKLKILYKSYMKNSFTKNRHISFFLWERKGFYREKIRRLVSKKILAQVSCLLNNFYFFPFPIKQPLNFSPDKKNQQNFPILKKTSQPLPSFLQSFHQIFPFRISVIVSYSPLPPNSLSNLPFTFFLSGKNYLTTDYI